MIRRTLTFDIKDKNWKPCNEAILSEEEISIEIGCECGNQFWVYCTDAGYRCECGRVYLARISVDIEATE